MTREEVGGAQAGMWPWLMQRVTAVLLLVFLGLHIWALHYAVVGEEIRFDRVSQRLQSPLFIFVDAGLLAVVLYHALNGTRTVLLDFEMGEGTERAITWLLIVVGLATFLFGANALLPFVTGNPLFYR